MPYTDEVMTPIEYSIDLPASASTVLTVSGRTLGVGSNGCGPRPLDQYMLWSAPAFEKPAAARTAPRGKVISASIYEPGEGDVDHAVDGDWDTFWHSRWSGQEVQPPHYLVIDYGKTLNMASVLYVARGDGNNNGRIRDYEVYASEDPQRWGSPVAKGRFSRREVEQSIEFPHPVKARYLKFVALSEERGQPFAAVAELEVTEAKAP